MRRNAKQITILLVEDDEIDRMAFHRAFAKRGIQNKIEVAYDGSMALDILMGTEESPPLMRPYILILDTTLPRMDGFELLARLRSEPSLKDTVVFVLATSDVYRDVAEAYGRNVAGYLVKPTTPEEYSACTMLFEAYLMSVVLPT